MNNSVLKKLLIVNIIVAVIVTSYCLVAFTEIPLISEARDLWIETAMTTAEHHWLATRFFPRWLIDRVMSRQIVTEEGVISDPDLLVPHSGGGASTWWNITVSASPGNAQDNNAGNNPHGGANQSAGWDPTGGNASGGDNAFNLSGRHDGDYPSDGDGARDGNAAGDMPDGFNPERDVTEGDEAADIIALGSRGWFMRRAVADTAPSDNTVNYRPNYTNPAVPGMSFFNVPEFYIEEVVETPLTSYYLPSVGDVDELGNTVIISDEKEEIVVVEIRKTGYTGRILFVPDPSRVVVSHTNNKNVRGEFIRSYLNKYGAIAGMNGNGFDDPEGKGAGGTIIGWSVSDGKEWGYGSKAEYASVGFNDQHVLMVGIIKDFKKHNIRDLAQYGPTIIVNGKKLISGSGGWGIQPRSAIGQREDGAVLMATFDGRQPGHSLGITAGEIADIFGAYGCVNAGLCDGGSSSIMMYDDAILGKPSTPMKDTGRYLPNAFLVLSKEQADDRDF